MDRLTISNDDVAITLAKSEEAQIKVVSGDTVTTEVIGGSIDEGMYTEEGMFAETGMPEIKDPLLSSWPFVIGISAAVLFVSVVLGAFLAKRKIKKGIELYED